MTFSARIPYKVETRGDEETESHESFGLVSIHRVQGGDSRLFGSSIEKHNAYFCIEIKRAQRIHNLSHDRFFGREQLIEINLSAAQFAEMITTPNMGSGTPCTIRRVMGVQMEPLPVKMETESKKIRTTFQDGLEKLTATLAQKAKEVDTILEKKNLTQIDRKTISRALQHSLMEVQSNLPFVLESFQESTERVMTHAKAEMDAFISMSLHKIGVKALHDRIGAGESPMKVLSPGEVPEDAEEV